MLGLALAGAPGWAALPPPAPGDVNGDGKIDVLDVILEVRFAVGVQTPTPAQLQVADVFPIGAPDGRITVGDVVVVAKLALGLLDPGLLQPAPTISSFAPASAPIGTLVTIQGANLQPARGSAALVTLARIGGGTLQVGAAVASASTASFVIPDGATTGTFTMAVNGHAATSAAALTVVPTQDATLTATPASLSVIQGQKGNYAVQLMSQSGFSALAALSLSGLPSGMAATFSPPQITSGQTSLLTVSARMTQPTGTAGLTITASAAVDGLPVSPSQSS